MRYGRVWMLFSVCSSALLGPRAAVCQDDDAWERRTRPQVRVQQSMLRSGMQDGHRDSATGAAALLPSLMQISWRCLLASLGSTQVPLPGVAWCAIAALTRCQWERTNMPGLKHSHAFHCAPTLHTRCRSLACRPLQRSAMTRSLHQTVRAVAVGDKLPSATFRYFADSRWLPGDPWIGMLNPALHAECPHVQVLQQ